MGIDNISADLTAMGYIVRRRWYRMSKGTRYLLTANVAVFCGFRVRRLRGFMYRHFAMSWENTVRGRRWHTLGTSVIAHDSALHLAFNCMAATALVPFLEKSMDRHNEHLRPSMQAAAFILISGVCANLFGLMMAMAVPPLLCITSVGMSGGLYSAFAVITQAQPHVQWQLLFFPQPISSETMLTCMMGFDTLGLMYLMSGGVSLIAHHVHLMGAVTGLVAQQYILPKPPRPPHRQFLDRFFRK